MKLIKYLANLGYGTRREVTDLVAHGRCARAAQAHGLRLLGERRDPPDLTAAAVALSREIADHGSHRAARSRHLWPASAHRRWEDQSPPHVAKDTSAESVRCGAGERPARDEEALLASGTMMLHGETVPLLSAALEMLGPHHQVRRMFAAVGNHVVALHRRPIGGLELGRLEVGQWPELSFDEVAALLP